MIGSILCASSLLISLLPGVWSSPKVSGTRPPPCAAFTLTMIDNHRAVLFGGDHRGVTTNDVYIIDLTRMVSGVQDLREGGQLMISYSWDK